MVTTEANTDDTNDNGMSNPYNTARVIVSVQTNTETASTITRKSSVVISSTAPNSINVNRNMRSPSVSIKSNVSPINTGSPTTSIGPSDGSDSIAMARKRSIIRGSFRSNIATTATCSPSDACVYPLNIRQKPTLIALRRNNAGRSLPDPPLIRWTMRLRTAIDSTSRTPGTDATRSPSSSLRLIAPEDGMSGSPYTNMTTGLSPKSLRNRSTAPRAGSSAANNAVNDRSWATRSLIGLAIRNAIAAAAMFTHRHR